MQPHKHDCGHTSYTAISEPGDKLECPVCLPEKMTCEVCAPLIAAQRHEIETLTDDLAAALREITKLQGGQHG